MMSDFLVGIAEKSLTTEQAIRPRPLSAFEPFQANGAAGSAHQKRAEQDNRLFGSNKAGSVIPAPVAVSAEERRAGQGEAGAIDVQAPRLSVSAAIDGSQPVASTPVDQPGREGNFRTVGARDPRLGISVVIADPHPVATAPVGQTGSGIEDRLATGQSPSEGKQTIGPKVPADETNSPASGIGSKLPLESPDEHRTATTSGPHATEGWTDRTGRESGVPGHQSDAAGTISEGNLVKPIMGRIEMEIPVGTQLPRQPITPLHSRLETAWREKNDSMRKENANQTIHVTIGRIEVRATPPPVQNQPKTRAPSALSLDEYMRRRNGDGR